MGLILEDKRFAVLSDILGDEDHLGDMDFKLPVPIRVSRHYRWTSRLPASPRRSCGLRSHRRRTGASTSSAKMAQALTAARGELGAYAPRIETFKIPTDKIREVIGSGGKVIREIVRRPAPRSISRTTAP